MTKPSTPTRLPPRPARRSIPVGGSSPSGTGSLAGEFFEHFRSRQFQLFQGIASQDQRQAGGLDALVQAQQGVLVMGQGRTALGVGSAFVGPSDGWH